MKNQDLKKNYLVLLSILIIVITGIVILLLLQIKNNTKFINTNVSSKSIVMASKESLLEFQKILVDSKSKVLSPEGFDLLDKKEEEHVWLSKPNNNDKKVLMYVWNTTKSPIRKAVIFQFEFSKETGVERELSIGMNEGTYQEALEIANTISSIEDINKGLTKGEKGYDGRFSEISISTRAEQLQKKQAEEQREQKIQEVCGEPNMVDEFNETTKFSRRVTTEQFKQCSSIYLKMHPEASLESMVGPPIYPMLLKAIEESQSKY